MHIYTIYPLAKDFYDFNWIEGVHSLLTTTIHNFQVIHLSHLKSKVWEKCIWCLFEQRAVRHQLAFDIFLFEVPRAKNLWNLFTVCSLWWKGWIWNKQRGATRTLLFVEGIWVSAPLISIQPLYYHVYIIKVYRSYFWFSDIFSIIIWLFFGLIWRS